MSSPSHPFYTKTPECLIAIFDLTHPGAKERLHREVAAWHGYADVVNLTAEASVLVIRPGGATKVAA
jgi:hypothetical protein